MWFQQWEINIYLMLIFLLPTVHEFGRWRERLFDIQFLILSRIITLKKLVGYPSIEVSSLNFRAQLSINEIYYILNIVIIVN